MNFLETQRLILKKPTLENLKELEALQSDPDVMQYVGNGSRSVEEVKAWAEKAKAHFEKHQFSICSVYEKETGDFVGRAGLIYLAYDDTQPDIEVGYVLNKKFWRKGYATELAGNLLNWAFDHLRILKLVGVIHPENENSRRVLQKVGMHYLGKDTYGNKEVARYEIFNPVLDQNKINITAASFTEYEVFQNLARFYAYDISGFMIHETNWETPPNGLYEGMDFKKYWSDPHCTPFLIHYENELAGFAIVDKKGTDENVDFNMAQFFIVNKFKGMGLGGFVAKYCFEKFRGEWEIMVLPRNEGAYHFWRSLILKFTTNQFTEITRRIPHLQNNIRNLIRFNSNQP